MKTIWKFQLPAENVFHIIMPAGARLLSVQIQHGKPVLWAMVDELAARVPRRLALIGTGHEVLASVEGYQFVGTFQLMDGALVFHLFDGGEA